MKCLLGFATINEYCCVLYEDNSNLKKFSERAKSILYCSMEYFLLAVK